ncbi:PEP/pyruvate-binding domain-containing protein [Pseudarthrobacter sp. BRE9]|uniref:PEP/pyruvate-binding domain-containing protein n=1 Tax=Pseudarthrobacter sp. BRE9 TaxID=2962582 RepID=UPI0028828F32|nr:PEP/pyruvate-binding domain-containing protein [Pseudarthrobacter sp. BRE9]MDT0167776.1 PEP/pyruvate-binding domain-containing protein [Pseudarthrobacter sp. BRE9]
MDHQTVGPLEEFGARDLAMAGGKGANLGELVRAGFPVPPGFVITTAAYRTLLGEAGLGASLTALLAADAPAAELRQLLRAAPVPGQLREGIAAAYAALGSGPVAVRSSATAEDLPGAAFAGQQDTYLNILGESAVLRAVIDCWASLWTDRAISYRQRQGIEARGVAMAVVVQKMVPADTAGVMFSANPVTGERREIVIDAGPGLGEAVVSGEVTPDRYVLDLAGRLRGFIPAGHRMGVLAKSQGGTTTTTSGVPQARPGLSSAQLAELARLAVRAQGHFGCPQDIEWAIADGRIYLVQARPITALPPQPLRLSPFQRLVGPFFLEMFQVRPYPLDVSGWMQRGILAMLHGMAGSVGVSFPPLQKLLPEEDGVVLRLVPPVPKPTVRTLAAPFSLVRRARRYDPARWTKDHRFAAFLAGIGRLKAQDPRALPWQGVIALAEDAFATMRGITELRISYLPAVFLSQLKLRLMLLLLGKRKLAQALIAGAQTRTSQANGALEQLAAQVRSSQELTRLFTRLQAGELLGALEQGQEFADFRSSLREFLAEYGHRETVSVVLSSAPTWSDAPDVVLALISSMTGDRPPSTDQTGEAVQDLMRHPALRIPALRRRLLADVATAKAGMAFREDTHFYATMVLPPLRRSLLDLGRRLTETGVLAEPGEVHNLRFEELSAMHDGGALPAADQERYRRLVLARAAKRRELEGIPLLEPGSLFTRSRSGKGALLSGTPASRGQAKGTVRIIRGPEEFGLLRSGEILVCPYTNPSWTPLFQRAAAVVVDLGGIGSHAAIVAREYGIPAVMGTGSGTRTLVDGQTVIVDGSAGRVTAA